MSGDAPTMSLIPYHPQEGREIVLRHRNAIVVRDPSSQRLEIRGLTECPTCHQPFRASSPERAYDSSPESESFVNPDYFRMLRRGHEYPHPDHPPSSPIRRLVHSFDDESDDNDNDDNDDDDDESIAAGVQDAEFLSSTPAVQEGSRIRKEAFQPNYFKTFFVEERELGRGGKGVVLLVRHEIDGCQLGHFACKRVPVGDDHAWLEKVLIEVELLAKLSHPNLVSYRHVWLEDVKLNRFGPSVACAFILQQYCNGGDLLKYVIGSMPREVTKEELKAQMRRRSKDMGEKPTNLWETQRRLPFEEIYSLFKDITNGLAYLHASNYIHRDLKPSNCLLNKEGGRTTCLISDFGEVQQENVARKSTGSTGTISYCAPEVLQMDSTGKYGNFTTKSDIFSLGMILYFMCFGRLPYQSANAIQEELEDIDLLRAEITDWKGFQDERRARPDLPSKLYQLLKRLLAINPNERPSTSELLLVMKTESGLDGGMPRAPNPPIALQGRRIHDLESPLLPSTPVPDPKKRDIVTTASQDNFDKTIENEFSPQPTAQNSLQKMPTPTTPRRHRAPSMTLSRSEDGYHQPRASPQHRNSSPIRRARRTSPSMNTPLLMPAPTTFWGDVSHRSALALHQSTRFLGGHDDTVIFITRLGLFLMKMASLTHRCWPYAINMGIGASLVAVAGLELGMPSGHYITTGRQESARFLRRPWTYRSSFMLFGLHFFVLWIAGRWGSLCPAIHARWEDWRP